MDFETQRELHNKANTWDITRVEDKVSELKSKNTELMTEISSLRNEIYELKDIIRNILYILVDIPDYTDIQNDLYEILYKIQ